MPNLVLSLENQAMKIYEKLYNHFGVAGGDHCWIHLTQMVRIFDAAIGLSLSTAPFWCCATAKRSFSQTCRRTRLQNQCPSSRGMFVMILHAFHCPISRYGTLLLLLFLFA